MRCIALLALIAITTASAQADIIDVPTDHPTIQEAINAAHTSDEVVVAPGTYNETINMMGKAITLRSTDPEDPDVVATTIIDAQQAGSVITCNSEERQDTRISGLTITGGRANKGGGLLNFFSSPTVTHCTFSENFAVFGGGMANLYESSPRVIDCVFIRNTALNAGGGMSDETASAPTIMDCTFNENTSNNGGAMASRQSSKPRVRNCSFVSNTAFSKGGGIQTTELCVIRVASCTFTDNVAGTAGGGGIANDGSQIVIADCSFTANLANLGPGGGVLNSDSTGTILNCIFVDNSALSGGGVADFRSFNLSVSECVFTANTATSGGGIYISDFAARGARVTNCSFGQNEASRGAGAYITDSEPHFTNCEFNANASNTGGGLYVAGSQPVIINCTLTKNTASAAGGALYNTVESAPALANCVLWDNSPDEISVESGSPMVTFCDVLGGYSGEGNIQGDPLFVDPDGLDGIPGTDDDDLRLLPGSPCIDAADNTAFPMGITTDLGDQLRFVDDPATTDTGICTPGTSVIDMGAYELQAGPPCPSDVDADGDVDLDDLQLLLFDFGTGC